MPAPFKATRSAFVCDRCGAEPHFAHIAYFGANMADAQCLTPGCAGGSYRCRRDTDTARNACDIRCHAYCPRGGRPEARSHG